MHYRKHFRCGLESGRGGGAVVDIPGAKVDVRSWDKAKFILSTKLYDLAVSAAASV